MFPDYRPTRVSKYYMMKGVQKLRRGDQKFLKNALAAFSRSSCVDSFTGSVVASVGSVWARQGQNNCRIDENIPLMVEFDSAVTDRMSVDDYSPRVIEFVGANILVDDVIEPLVDMVEDFDFNQFIDDSIASSSTSVNDGDLLFRSLDNDEEIDVNLIASFDEELWSDPLDELRRLFLELGISVSQGSGILRYLAKKYPTDGYPRTCKTFMGTPKEKVPLIDLQNGKYYYYGLESALGRYSNEVLASFRNKDLQLDVGIDGFQFSKSSKRSGWPILVSLSNSNLDPVLVGLYVGSEKLNDVNSFLRPFCEEI